MAGIYVHIPFCKSRCKYCDFYSTTGLERSDRRGISEAYTEALCREMEIRKDYLQGEPVRTLYFGGGTPSQLSPALLGRIVSKAERTFGFHTLNELTIEVNPDDLSQAWIDGLKEDIPQHNLRISMGIQTFDDDLLRMLGRRHTAQEAIDAVHRLQENGITEISVDLMYGLPGRDGDEENYEEIWQRDLEMAVGLGVPHLSAYHLSYEEGTPLYLMRKRGEIRERNEEESLGYFHQLRQTLLTVGYRHYEISNFALPGHEAQHNSSYWNGTPYLGLGPGAHSYNGSHRSWNDPELQRYLKMMGGDGLNGKRWEDIGLAEGEVLSEDDRYNEYIMTRLRTAHGISPTEIGTGFGEERECYLRARAQTYLKSHRLRETTDGRWILTEEGIFVSDAIIADLFC